MREFDERKRNVCDIQRKREEEEVGIEYKMLSVEMAPLIFFSHSFWPEL